MVTNTLEKVSLLDIFSTEDITRILGKHYEFHKKFSSNVKEKNEAVLSAYVQLIEGNSLKDEIWQDYLAESPDFQKDMQQHFFKKRIPSIEHMVIEGLCKKDNSSCRVVLSHFDNILHITKVDFTNTHLAEKITSHAYLAFLDQLISNAAKIFDHVSLFVAKPQMIDDFHTLNMEQIIYSESLAKQVCGKVGYLMSTKK